MGETMSYDPDYYEDDVNIAEKLISLKENAEDRGIEFDLSFAHLKRILRRKTCYYTGRRFSSSVQDYKTIERVDNDKGYTDDNTVCVCQEANQAKGSMTLGELEKMVKQIKKHKNK